MTSLWNGLRNLPSTNFRIFVSVILEAVFVVVVLTGMVLGRTMNTEIVWAVGLLITGWLGLGVAQFASARMTDREYAAVKNAATAPAPTVTVEAPAQVNVAASPAAAAVPTPPPISSERGTE